MNKEDILRGLRRLRPSEGQCAGCGYEHSAAVGDEGAIQMRRTPCGCNCGGGCRIGREAAELIEEQERKLETALGQLKAAEDACPTCVHGKGPLPCAEDDDPVGLCDTCERDCVCRGCEDHDKWEWSGGEAE